MGWDASGDASGWGGDGGKANWIFGASATAVENLSGIARFGSNLRFYGATARGGVFLGNQYVRTFSLARTGKVLGFAGARLGLIMYEWKNINSNSQKQIDIASSGENLFIYNDWI